VLCRRTIASVSLFLSLSRSFSHLYFSQCVCYVSFRFAIYFFALDGSQMRGGVRRGKKTLLSMTGSIRVDAESPSRKSGMRAGENRRSRNIAPERIADSPFVSLAQIVYRAIHGHALTSECGFSLRKKRRNIRKYIDKIASLHGFSSIERKIPIPRAMDSRVSVDINETWKIEKKNEGKEKTRCAHE